MNVMKAVKEVLSPPTNPRNEWVELQEKKRTMAELHANLMTISGFRQMQASAPWRQLQDMFVAEMAAYDNMLSGLCDDVDANRGRIIETRATRKAMAKIFDILFNVVRNEEDAKKRYSDLEEEIKKKEKELAPPPRSLKPLASR